MAEKQLSPQMRNEMAWLDLHRRTTEAMQRVPGIDIMARPGLLNALKVAEAAVKPVLGIQMIVGKAVSRMPRIGATHADQFLRLAEIGKVVAKDTAFDAIFEMQRVGDAALKGSPRTRIFADIKAQQAAIQAIGSVWRDHEVWHRVAARPWEELRDSIETASTSLGDEIVQGAVRGALADSNEQSSEDDDRSGISFSVFLASLFRRLDPATAITIALTVVLWLANPYYDTRFKDAFFKASQEEDRRALAREIAKEGSKVDPLAAYRASRRVAMKAMEARQNPKALSPRIGQVRMGEVVELVSTEKDWSQIMWQDGTGRQLSGWVFTRYLKPLK